MCTHLYTCIHIYTHLYTSLHIYTHLYKCIHKYTHVYTSIHIYTHLYTSIHIYTHLYTCMHMYTHEYTCIHIYTHVYTPHVQTLVNYLSRFCRTKWLVIILLGRILSYPNCIKNSGIFYFSIGRRPDSCAGVTPDFV